MKRHCAPLRPWQQVTREAAGGRGNGRSPARPPAHCDPRQGKHSLDLRFFCFGLLFDLLLFAYPLTGVVFCVAFSLFAELERDLISLRTKEARAVKKKQGVRLGKPKRTIQESQFDADHERIKDLLKIGLSLRKIATRLGYYRNHLALNTSINKRKLREQGS